MNRLSQEEFFKSLPRKIVGAATVFLNEADEVLMVKPNYRTGWLLPGGAVEQLESPQEACIRETKEETNLDIVSPKLLSVFFSKRLDVTPKYESLQFIFFGGKLSSDDIKKIKVQKKELDDFAFYSREEALKLVGKSLGKRLSASLDALASGAFSVYGESEGKGQ
ncbi:MAG: NUDIX hydrolase [Candidatus Paceibacterota bacterium]|jgi:ADP-ribose pyrophosphatase YjhB (NUDIX family)